MLSNVKQELRKQKQKSTRSHFVCSVQGAREEGPADLERANTDAQVINF